jgi:alkylation response protein AidB-like acyl-CoA dehydrogenase
MDFTLGERQQAVAGLAAQVLAGPDPSKALAQAGLLDVSPPDGLGVLEVAVLLTEIGRRAPACWRLSEDRDPGADLAVAAYWCAEQAPRSVRSCHHLHGGLGMDATYLLHRFSSLVADLVRFLGGAQYRLDRCSST